MSENQAADYEATPEEQHARWTVEFTAARKALEHWRAKGDEIDAEFRNEMKAAGEYDTRLPLFASDVQTMIAMLYGQVPRCVVSRRFGDSSDDLARVAGEILERVLNTDISRDSDTYAVALRCVLMDFFLPGFGQARCRYVMGEVVSEEVAAEMDPVTGQELVAAYTKESRPKEDVEVDYIHWKDWLWGPAKVPHDVPWWAHCSEMTRAQLVKRFGAEGKLVPLEKRKDGTEDPWSRAKVWEIYEKASRTVFWFCELHPRILDTKEDPLQLDGFFPFPQPLVSNLTTSKVVPRPYYALHQDQYRQINVLMSRIREQVDQIKVAGICNKEDWEQLHKVLTPEGRNRLIPVPNFAALAERGGIPGAISWYPNELAIQVIAQLQQQLVSEIDLLRQATGFADIMRGEATQAGATATEQRAKTRAGSVRVQRLQDEIARFATDLLKIKGEIVCKHFAPETIFERANVRFMPEADQAIAMQAIELLKKDFYCYRIEVKPEAVALADFAAMKAERTEFLATVTTYFQALAPIAAQMPDGLEDLLEIGKWVAAGIRGSSQIEGVFDRMIQKAKAAAKQAKENPQAAPPDPKLLHENAKTQGALAKIEAETQARQMELAAEVQAQAQIEANQSAANVREHAQKQMISNALKPVQVPRAPGGLP